MDNVTEVAALIRQQAVLEPQIMNGHDMAMATERELETTRRLLATHPQALNAVPKTARALLLTSDAVAVRDVTEICYPH